MAIKKLYSKIFYHTKQTRLTIEDHITDVAVLMISYILFHVDGLCECHYNTKSRD